MGLVIRDGEGRRHIRLRLHRYIVRDEDARMQTKNTIDLEASRIRKMSRAENEVCFKCGCWCRNWDALVRHREQAHGLEAGRRNAPPSNTGAREKARPVVPLMQVQTLNPRLSPAISMRGIRPTSIGGAMADPNPGLSQPAPTEVQRAQAPAALSTPEGLTVEKPRGTPSSASPPQAQQGSWPSAHSFVVQQGRLELLVEVACRWSRKFCVAQVREMLEATFPDVEKMLRDAVAFGLARVRPPAASAVALGSSATTSHDIGAATLPPLVNLQPLQDSGTGQNLEEDELMHLLEEYSEFTDALGTSLAPLEAPAIVKDEQ